MEAPIPALFSTPKAPTIPTPTVMPTPDNAAIQSAQQAQLAGAMARSGRQSTLLSQNDKLGS